MSSRKSYKHEDMEDEEETVVLFSREGEGSHDLDWAQVKALMAWAQLLPIILTPMTLAELKYKPLVAVVN